MRDLGESEKKTKKKKIRCPNIASHHVSFQRRPQTSLVPSTSPFRNGTQKPLPFSRQEQLKARFSPRALKGCQSYSVWQEQHMGTRATPPDPAGQRHGEAAPKAGGSGVLPERFRTNKQNDP